MVIRFPWQYMPCTLQYAVPGFKCVPLLQALNGYQLEEEKEEEEEEEEEGEEQGRTEVQSDPLQL